MRNERTINTASVTRDGVAGFLLGVGLGTFIGLILRPPEASAGVPVQNTGALGGFRDKVEIASKESFPTSDAPEF
jgi:hypothetical protein